MDQKVLSANEKRSIALKGHEVSKETRLKIRESVRNYTDSLSTEERKSIFGKGNRGKRSNKKGKSLEDLYGKVRAGEIKDKLKKNVKSYPIGTIMPMSGRGKRPWIKTEDGWILLHRYVWIKERGAIPTGYHIHHINGDILDNRIENLKCLSSSDHSKLHDKEGRLEKRVRASVESIKKKVKCIETGIVYDSLKEAAEKTGNSSTNISAVLKGNQKTTKKTHWEYYI